MVRDLDELRPPLGPEGDLAHPDILVRWPTRPFRPSTSPSIGSGPTGSRRTCCEEYYLHFAGYKDDLDIDAIYGRYEDLTTLDAALGLAGPAENDRGAKELWQFACGGYLGNLTKTQEARASELEATLEATVDGQTIPYRMLRPSIANEPDRDKRRALEEARCELGGEHLNPVHLEAAAILRDAVPTLGSENYVELYRRFGFRLDELAEQCRQLLDDTERMFEHHIDRLFRERVGVSLDEAERWDTPRLIRAAQWDQAFPSERMVPALEGTLEGLGIDMRAQPNVELDVEAREKKSPRAFCAPIEVPGRVVLVMKPMGGPDDWSALFHEAGHTEHFANTSADLPMESKRLGDNAVTEGWAFLLEHLVDNPEWLTRRLDFPRPQEFAAKAPPSSSGACAATAPSCSTSSSSSAPTIRCRSGSVTSSCSGAR